MTPIHKDRRRRLVAAAAEASEAQAAAAAAVARRDRLIVAAVQAGASLRQVADAAGLSVPRAQQVVQAARSAR